VIVTRELKCGGKRPIPLLLFLPEIPHGFAGSEPRHLARQAITNRLNQISALLPIVGRERRLKTKHGKAAIYEMDDSERKTCLTTVHGLV
jgi:hypothetical protein